MLKDLGRSKGLDRFQGEYSKGNVGMGGTARANTSQQEVSNMLACQHLPKCQWRVLVPSSFRVPAKPYGEGGSGVISGSGKKLRLLREVEMLNSVGDMPCRNKSMARVYV